MKSWLVCTALAAAACGSDDGGGMLPPCDIVVGGDVVASDTCRMFLCDPSGSDGTQSLLLSNATIPTVAFQLNIVVATPTVFAPGTLTLDQWRPATQVSVTLDGITYAARQTPANGGTRSPDEMAALTLDEVTPPSGGEQCNGSVVGTLTASLVEIADLGGPTEAAGAGRATLTVDLGH